MFGEFLLRPLLHLLPHSAITIHPLNCKVTYFLTQTPTCYKRKNAMIAKKLKEPNSSGWFDCMHHYTDFSSVAFVTIVERSEKWCIDNWPCGRSQRVMISSTGSNWSLLVGGIPQGSILIQYFLTYSSIIWMKGQIPAQQGHWWHRAGSSGRWPRGSCSPSEGAQQAGGMGREEPPETQQRWMQDSAPGEEQPWIPGPKEGKKDK